MTGKHSFVVLRPVSDPTTSADQIAIYNKIVSGVPQIFYRPNSNQTPIQLTAGSTDTGNDGATPPIWKVRQQSFVAGPFIFYVGFLSNPTDGDVITLTPSSNLIYVSLTPANSGRVLGIANLAPTSISSNQFTVRVRPNVFLPLDAYYIAVGIP